MKMELELGDPHGQDLFRRENVWWLPFPLSSQVSPSHSPLLLYLLSSINCGAREGKKQPLMAQITSQGRLKLLFKGGNGGPSEPRNLIQFKLSFHGGLLRLVGDCCPGIQRLRPRRSGLRVLASSSAHNTNRRLNAGERFRDSDSDDYDDEEFGEFEDDELSCFRGLVLDIAYRPVNVVCWKRAICLEFMEKADVLEYYDQTVNSPSGSFNIPAVLRVPHLLQVVKRKRIRNTLSRKNIFYRDDYTCQYCSSVSELTIDHVLPIARGGKWSWENLVTACAKCNSKKGQKTPEEANMTLARVPKAPKEFDILAIPLTAEAIRMLRRKGTPTEWRQYLPK